MEPPSLAVSNAPRVRAAPAVISEAWAAQMREHPIEVGEVKYAGKVAAIVQDKCQGCHRPGQVGPFSLLII